MATTSAPGFAGSYSAKSLCRIVGLTCLAGFLVDMLTLVLPPDPMALEWRVGFMQQMSDRSIILLFGAALLIFGSSENRKLLKQLALASLIVGTLFVLSSLLVIRDGLILQNETITNINSQATELQTQIQQTQAANTLPENVTPELLQQASQQINTQAETLKQNAKTGVIRTGISSVGNLVIVGIGLISLGRYGARLRKSQM